MNSAEFRILSDPYVWILRGSGLVKPPMEDRNDEYSLKKDKENDAIEKEWVQKESSSDVGRQKNKYNNKNKPPG